MAKKVRAVVTLQLPAGKANPAPPVGPALGQHGVNIMDFCKAFNARTEKDEGIITPVVITVYHDRTFAFVTKTPPASVLWVMSREFTFRTTGNPNCCAISSASLGECATMVCATGI